MAEDKFVSAMPQDRWKCPEAIGHSIPDVQGRCMYCRRKIAAATPAPDASMTPTSELTEAYNEFYDPDWGALTWKEICAKYAMGQNP